MDEIEKLITIQERDKQDNNHVRATINLIQDTTSRTHINPGYVMEEVSKLTEQTTAHQRDICID